MNFAEEGRHMAEGQNPATLPWDTHRGGKAEGEPRNHSPTALALRGAAWARWGRDEAGCGGHPRYCRTGYLQLSADCISIISYLIAKL